MAQLVLIHSNCVLFLISTLLPRRTHSYYSCSSNHRLWRTHCWHRTAKRSVVSLTFVGLLWGAQKRRRLQWKGRFKNLEKEKWRVKVSHWTEKSLRQCEGTDEQKRRCQQTLTVTRKKKRKSGMLLIHSDPLTLFYFTFSENFQFNMRNSCWAIGLQHEM